MALVILGCVQGLVSAGWWEGDTGDAQPGDGGQTTPVAANFENTLQLFF